MIAFCIQLIHSAKDFFYSVAMLFFLCYFLINGTGSVVFIVVDTFLFVKGITNNS